MTGKPQPWNRGEQHPGWRGDQASYAAIHNWLTKYCAKAGVCEQCGKRRKTDWAFKYHPAAHTRNRADYLELCQRCHRRFDTERSRDGINDGEFEPAA